MVKDRLFSAFRSFFPDGFFGRLTNQREMKMFLGKNSGVILGVFAGNQFGVDADTVVGHQVRGKPVGRLRGVALVEFNEFNAGALELLLGLNPVARVGDKRCGVLSH